MLRCSAKCQGDTSLSSMILLNSSITAWTEQMTKVLDISPLPDESRPPCGSSCRSCSCCCLRIWKQPRLLNVPRNREAILTWACHLAWTRTRETRVQTFPCGRHSSAGRNRWTLRQSATLNSDFDILFCHSLDCENGSQMYHNLPICHSSTEIW